jgi:SPX domain protein involved in polyphosphate accumulation
MSFRIEKKVRLSPSEFHLIKSFLLDQGMKSLFPDREINSIYYDTHQYDLFHDSEEGVLPRKKIRIRWYSNKNQSKLEKKISSIEGRYKEVKNLKSNNLNFIFDKNYGYLTPSIMVSYKRSYFSYKALRITLDRSIKYINLRSHKHIEKTEEECVMEVKAQSTLMEGYIYNVLPFLRISRFSKYCRGVESFGQHLKI